MPHAPAHRLQIHLPMNLVTSCTTSTPIPMTWIPTVASLRLQQGVVWVDPVVLMGSRVVLVLADQYAHGYGLQKKPGMLHNTRGTKNIRTISPWGEFVLYKVPRRNSQQLSMPLHRNKWACITSCSSRLHVTFWSP